MSAISLEGRENSTRDVLVWKWSLTHRRLVCEGWRVIVTVVVVVAVIIMSIIAFGRRWASEGSAACHCSF